MIRIVNLKLALGDPTPLDEAVARRLCLPLSSIKDVTVVRRGLDARRYRGAPLSFVYDVDALAKGEAHLISGKDPDVSASPPPRQSVLLPTENLGGRLRLPPVVVGFGPSGIFCALVLARAGCAPVVLERGPDVDKRREAVSRFWAEGELDEAANVQFGEGGAGTFSDGKLTSRTKSPIAGDVLRELVAAGAPEEILTLAKPHIGTDLLAGVVKNLRREIERLGGTVRFGAKVTGIERRGSLSAVTVEGAERIPLEAAFFCIGHSARDTYEMLDRSGIHIEPKAFSIGVRVEHPQEMIDRAQYKEYAGDSRLPPADYALAFRDAATGRGVYSFCMCPGGMVVGAASEAGGIAINGMSRYARDSGVANSAVVVEVRSEDFSSGALGGVLFQRKYERMAFSLTGRSYLAPVMTLGDLVAGKSGSLDFLVAPSCRPGVMAADLSKCLPPFVTDALSRAMTYFGGRIAGLDDPATPLTGVETRTSSPCRIVRSAKTLESVSLAGLYPVGEGAGYAGGIMSSAVDGVRAALAFLEKIRHN